MINKADRKKVSLLLGLVLTLNVVCANSLGASPSVRQIPHLIIPILGTSLNKHFRPVGLVSQVVIDVHERQDRNGLQILSYQIALQLNPPF